MALGHCKVHCLFVCFFFTFSIHKHNIVTVHLHEIQSKKLHFTGNIQENNTTNESYLHKYFL